MSAPDNNTHQPTHNLTGAWLGVYEHPPASKIPATHFSAQLLDTESVLSGSIDETMQGFLVQNLKVTALIDGKMTGDRVAFTKTYDGKNTMSHSVWYEGYVDADGEVIRGTWIVLNTDRPLVGTFAMTKDPETPGLVPRRI